MKLYESILVLGLLAMLAFVACARNVRRRRTGMALIDAFLGSILLCAVAGTALISANLRPYQRITTEQSAGELSFARVGYHQFNGTLTRPSGETEDFALRGDEWQIDAHMLKWQALADFAGFDALYRLERISGRYTRIEDERSLPRTVYALGEPPHVDLWDLAHRYRAWVPWVDALYGSATYLPMEDGARYDIRVSESGLLARSLNRAAVAAVGNWQ